MKKLRTIFISMVLCTAIIAGLTSCRQTRQQAETAHTDERAELLVFNMVNEGFSVVESFKAQYFDTPINVISGMSSGMDALIQKYGEPDLILMDSDLETWAEQGYIADISEAFEADGSYRDEVYYEGTDAAGRIDGQLYALPLGIEIHYMTIREEAWRDSAFQEMPDHYTIQNLLDAMETELDQKTSETYRVFASWGTDSPVEWLWESGAIRVDGANVTVDQSLFEQICRIVQKEVRDKSNTEAAELFQGPTTDPRFAEGNYLACNWSTYPSFAPQIGLIFAQSANWALLEQEIHVLWRPMKEEVGEYAAQVSIMGAVGNHSTRPHEAYEVLRQMMDVPVITWTSPSGITGTPSPVNRQRAIDMIQQVEEGADEFYVGQAQNMVTVSKIPLNQELKEELEYNLTHITQIYRIPSKLNEELWEIMLESEVSQESYERALTLLEQYLAS